MKRNLDAVQPLFLKMRDHPMSHLAIKCSGKRLFYMRPLRFIRRTINGRIVQVSNPTISSVHLVAYINDYWSKQEPRDTYRRWRWGYWYVALRACEMTSWMRLFREEVNKMAQLQFQAFPLNWSSLWSMPQWTRWLGSRGAFWTRERVPIAFINLQQFVPEHLLVVL